VISTLRYLTIAMVAFSTPLFALSPEEETLVSGIEGLYRPDPVPFAPGTIARPRSGSALLREAFNRWNVLSSEARERLNPFMSLPDSGTAGSPSEAGSTWSVLETPHFKIHYRPTGSDSPAPQDANGNKIPDFVDNAGTYLEKVYQKEVGEMGFLPPPGDKQRIYLRKLQNNGLTHPLANQASWIELNTNILGYTKEVLGSYYDPNKVSRDPDGVEAGLLKAVCAHEYFHSCQARYSWSQPDWWAEGTADWIGNQVFPESGFYLNNVGPHLEAPHVSLFAQGDFYEYSASLFPTFLSESASEGTALVRRVWELCRSGTELTQALQQVAGDLPETFLLYASYNLLRNYKDGARMPAPRIEKVDRFPASFSPTAGNEPQHYGANFIRLTPSGNGTAKITVSPTGSHQLGVKLIAIDKESSSWTIVKTRPAGKEFLAQIPGVGDRVSEIFVVVANFTPGAAASYRLTASIE